MNTPPTIAATVISNDEFVEEQLSFSTADVKRIEFYGDMGDMAEFQGTPTVSEKRPKRFRLVDGELFPLDTEHLPANAQPLTEDAGIFRIIGLGRV
jgi:hypothetical protein